MMKDDGVDPVGGPNYSRYERTRVERVYKQTVTKENDLREAAPVNRTFQMNLANKNTSGELVRLKHSHSRLEIITEKVEKNSPGARMGDMRKTGNDSYEVNMMRHMEKAPTEKWDLPCTRAQEIGWLLAHANPVRAKTLKDLGRNRDYGSSANAETMTLGKSQSTPSVAHGASEQPWPHIPQGPPHAQLRDINKKGKFYRPKKFCEITLYADIYMRQMHCNPFGNCRGSGSDGTKKEG